MDAADFKKAQAFLAVANHLSFAKASQALRITPSRLSALIKSLETDRGAALFNRTTRYVALTDAGRQLFESLAPVVSALEKAYARKQDHGEKHFVAGTVRIQSPRIAYRLYLEPHLPALLRVQPDLKIEVSTDDSIEQVAAAKFDLTVRLLDFAPKDFVAVPLGPRLKQIAFASPKYLERYGRPKTPKDLLKHNCINWRQAGRAGFYNWEFSKNQKTISVPVDGTLALTDRSLVIAAALKGIGIGFWIEEPLRSYFEKKRLEPLLEGYAASFEGFHLVYPKRKQQSRAVSYVVDFFRRRAGRGTPGAGP
jgi:DNA-binding transcriptional LysR family regulator